MDPPLAKAKAKAKPISDGGSASVITDVRRGKRLLKNWQWREEWDVRETTLQTPRSVQKEREEVCQSRDSPAARGEMASCPLAAHGGVLVSAGTELTLFLVAGTVLCFGFSVRMMLITH